MLREEWEKRDELERLQEEQRILLDQEREKRREFEEMQRGKETQLQGKKLALTTYIHSNILEN